jgi:hypothetical protein
MNKDLWNVNGMQDVMDDFAEQAVAAQVGQAQGEVVNDAEPNLAV